MKFTTFRIFVLVFMGLIMFLNGLNVTIGDDRLSLHVYSLLGANLIATIGYFYLLAKRRAYMINESGRKPIGLFGKPKLLVVFLTASIMYLSVLIFLHHLNGFSYFPYFMAYMVVLILLLILQTAYDDKMLIHQQQY
jgi:hypothetical protein